MKYNMRSLCTGLLFALCAASVQAEPSLAERRAISAYQQNTFPAYQKQIQAAAGFALALDVKWNTIAKPGEAENYGKDEYWTKVYFIPLKNALAAVASDDMGKKALVAKLKSVVITYDDNGNRGAVFENGVLTLNYQPYANVDETPMKERAKQIQTVLENAL
ncbi:MAG: hypothetical protein LBF61_04510 [Azoarcus sp.]|jgi:hypothetical protein|nr:hypothetical protein [Azoarcus sp.]